MVGYLEHPLQFSIFFYFSYICKTIKIKMENYGPLMKCVDFAARKHADQRRKDPSRTPYINHPIGKITTSVEYID